MSRSPSAPATIHPLATTQGHGNVTGCSVMVAGPVTCGGCSQATLISAWPPVLVKADVPGGHVLLHHGVVTHRAGPVWAANTTRGAEEPSLPLSLLWLPLLANPSSCQEQDFSIPVWSD